MNVLIVVGAYLLGSIPFGYLLPRLVRGEDVRTRGVRLHPFWAKVESDTK